MQDFIYHRPESLGEARDLFARGIDPRFLAGGQTLIPTLKQRLATPSDLIDLQAIPDLAVISVNPGAVTIGAMARHDQVATSAEIRKLIPALCDLAGSIGDPLVRHMGTLGGSVANNDPSADYPAAVLALGATIHTTGRTIAADDFFRGMFETALEPGELIVKIAFPVPGRSAYAKFPNPASRYAMAGVFVAKFRSGVRVAVTGAASGVFRVPEMERALLSNFSAASIAGIVIPADGLNSDIHASAEYRAHLVGVMAQRAVGTIA